MGRETEQDQALSGPAVRPELLFRRLVDGGMVYDSRSRRVHHLNESAVVVWESLAERLPPAAAAARLCSCFEVNADRAAADVTDIVARFRAAGLLDEEAR